MIEWNEFHEKHKDKIELVPGVDCWIWTGSVGAGGHGRVNHRRQVQYAHRLAFAHSKGPIPKGMVVRHLCGCSACVRPGHLAVGTHADNSRDTVEMERTQTKLSKSDVRELRRLYNCGMPLKDIAEKFGIAFGSVYPIVTYKSFIHLDPHMKGKHVRRVTNRVTDEQIAEVRRLILEGKRNCEIQEIVGVAGSAVSNIRTGARYADR